MSTPAKTPSKTPLLSPGHEAEWAALNEEKRRALTPPGACVTKPRFRISTYSAKRTCARKHAPG